MKPVLIVCPKRKRKGSLKKDDIQAYLALVSTKHTPALITDCLINNYIS